MSRKNFYKNIKLQKPIISSDLRLRHLSPFKAKPLGLDINRKSP